MVGPRGPKAPERVNERHGRIAANPIRVHRKMKDFFSRIYRAQSIRGREYWVCVKTARGKARFAMRTKCKKERMNPREPGRALFHVNRCRKPVPEIQGRPRQGYREVDRHSAKIGIGRP